MTRCSTAFCLIEWGQSDACSFRDYRVKRTLSMLLYNIQHVIQRKSFSRIAFVFLVRCIGRQSLETLFVATVLVWRIFIMLRYQLFLTDAIAPAAAAAGLVVISGLAISSERFTLCYLSRSLPVYFDQIVKNRDYSLSSGSEITSLSLITTNWTDLNTAADVVRRSKHLNERSLIEEIIAR